MEKHVKPGIYLSVIVPAYNEAERLPETLRRFQQYLPSKPFSYEIIVALDGPTDNTLEVLEGMASEIRGLRILDRRAHRGKGYTVKEGMLQALGRVRLFCDADNSIDISHFDRIQPLLDEGYDLVICSRHPRDAPGARQIISPAWYKRLMGIAGNLWIQLLVVRGIWDTQCGFKAFRDYAAERIFSQNVINGWGFDIEVLALARALNYKIEIVPAFWVDKPGSHVTPSSYLEVLLDTVRIWRVLSKDKYKLEGGKV